MGFENKRMCGHILAMVQETIRKKLYPLGNSNFNTLILTIQEWLECVGTHCCVLMISHSNDYRKICTWFINEIHLSPTYLFKNPFIPF